MFAETLSKYIAVPLTDIEQLLDLPLADLYDNFLYRYLIEQLDVERLYETLPEARRVLDLYLPALAMQVKSKYSLEHFPLTSYMLCNWVIGFLRYPDELWRMTEKHTAIPPYIIREVVPEVLTMFDHMTSGAALWQHTFAVIVLPLGSDTRT